MQYPHIQKRTVTKGKRKLTKYLTKLKKKNTSRVLSVERMSDPSLKYVDQ